jgi:hypothetical protein
MKELANLLLRGLVCLAAGAGVALAQQAPTVRGRVLDPQGRPLPGVAVRTSDDDATPPGRTDADGAFEVPAPGSKRVYLGGRRHARVSLRIPANGEVGLVALERAGVWSGSVVDADGQPIAGARVLLLDGVRSNSDWIVFCDDPRKPLRRSSTSTDERGRFVAFGAPRHSVQAVASAPGFERSQLVRAIPGQPLAFVLQPVDAPSRPATPRPAAEPLRLRAVDATSGAAIPAFRAGIYWPGGSLARVASARAASLTGSEDGAVVFDRPRRSYRVAIQAEGFARTSREVQNGDLEVALRPEASIRGVVRDASGKALAGVQVRVALGSVPNDHLQEFTEQAPVEAVTARDGSFRIRGLPAGGCSLIATHPERRPSGLEVVALADGEHVRGIELRSPTAARITVAVTGQVRDPRWRLRLQNQSLRSSTATTDTSGGVPVQPTTTLHGLAPGTYQLQLVVPQPPRLGGYRKVALQEVAVTPGDADAGRAIELQLDLDRDGPRQVSGELTFPLAVPRHERIAVVFEPVRPYTKGYTYLGLYLTGAIATIGTDGRFVAPVEPGDHRMIVVDLATRVVLATQPVTVAAGARNQDLGELPVAARALELELAGGGAQRVDRVEVRIGSGWPADIGHMQGEPPRDRPADVAIPIVAGRQRLPAWIPTGDVDLIAFSGRRQGTMLGSARAAAQRSAASRVRIPVGGGR